MTEIERALSDIAEVRHRLAGVQQFKGYSALAAAISGVFALVAGVLQAVLVGTPASAAQGRMYFAIWFVCSAASILINYSAIAHWFVNDANARDRWQTRTVGLSMLPAIVAGAVLSFALLRAELFAFLPGVWFICYGLGLFASRLTVPRGVLAIASAFLAAGGILLFLPAQESLQWWINAGGFALGQFGIALLVVRDRAELPR
ncbi:MAG: hypothetical protein M3N19_00585 [Candidatus Eremiobacteraeota bacterium]|nr:hypothetical protein [Candidatus Eremiobacteraeota bacterium]